MTEAHILDTVRKLLELSRKNDNVAEASNAAEQAQKLMTKHIITEAMVASGAPSDVIGVGLLHKHSARNMPAWKSALARALCEVNQCHVFRHGNELRIVGRDTDTNKVRYLFAYIVREIDLLTEGKPALLR